MIIAIIVLLAVIAAEAALALWMASEKRAPEDRENRERDSGGSEDLEKRWQEGVSAVMGYDLAAARRAVRDGDGDEE